MADLTDAELTEALLSINMTRRPTPHALAALPRDPSDITEAELDAALAALHAPVPAGPVDPMALHEAAAHDEADQIVAEKAAARLADPRVAANLARAADERMRAWQAEQRRRYVHESPRPAVARTRPVPSSVREATAAADLALTALRRSLNGR